LLPQFELSVENLYLLSPEIPKERLIFISSDTFRIAVALNLGFVTIPVIYYASRSNDDYQLNLLENYILKLMHINKLGEQPQVDF